MRHCPRMAPSLSLFGGARLRCLARRSFQSARAPIYNKRARNAPHLNVLGSSEGTASGSGEHFTVTTPLYYVNAGTPSQIAMWITLFNGMCVADMLDLLAKLCIRFVTCSAAHGECLPHHSSRCHRPLPAPPGQEGDIHYRN
jgi:hypothetical protein